MIIQLSLIRIDPQRVGETAREIERQARKIAWTETRGLRQSLWIESLEDSGSVIWLSSWDSLKDCQTFMAGPVLMSWVAAVQSHLQADPLWFRYRILVDVLKLSQGGYITEGGETGIS
jgi:hypothetical protein